MSDFPPKFMDLVYFDDIKETVISAGSNFEKPFNYNVLIIVFIIVLFCIYFFKLS